MSPRLQTSGVYKFLGGAVKTLLPGLLLLVSTPSGAVFVRSQMERIDHETLFDSEYFLDLLSFSPPAEWEALWRASTAPVSYRINTASLDCCQFLMEQDLRLEKRLPGGLAFRFRFAQREDKERQELHHWLELEKSLYGGFSALVFGEPTFKKEDADLGFGLAWTRGPWRAEARHLFVDFNFNERGSTTERDARKPFSDQALLSFSPGQDELRASVEYDAPMIREVPAESRVFSYRRAEAKALWRRRRPGGVSPRAEYAYEFQRKADLFNPDPAPFATVDHARRVHRALLSGDAPLGEKDALEAGGAVLSRSARSSFAHAPGDSADYRRWELQPYARWRRALRPWAVSELAAFLSFGEDRRDASGGPAPAAFDRLAEAKLGAGLDFLFGPSGRIGLYGAFDLDGPGHVWDGGAARAMFFF